MHSQTRTQRGFTLIELLVVIAIIALLAAILFPVFAKAQAKAKETQCMSNVRNLTLAMTMFAQDNQNKFPIITNPAAVGGNIDFSGTWASQIASYAGNQKIFTCPIDTNGAGYVSYGFNGLLLSPDGVGVQTANVINPSEVGMFVDATSYKYPEAGVINWQGDSHSGNATQFVARHSYNITYCDGHAATIGGTANQNINSITSPIHEAFFGAAGFGWVSNTGAGVVEPTSAHFNAATQGGGFSIAGSTTCGPLWDAACAGWVAAGGAQPTTSYTGSDAAATGDLGGRSSFKSTAPYNIVASDAIAKDGMAIIISANSRLNLKSITPTQIGDIFSLTSNDKIGGSNNVHVFSRVTAAGLDTETVQTANGPVADYGSGTASFLLGWIKANGTGYSSLAYLPDGTGDPLAATIQYPYDQAGVLSAAPSGFAITTVASTADMLAGVANDPYGIGYCSVGEADPTLSLIHI